jgi:hypothetical protein
MGKTTIAHTGPYFQERDYGKIDKFGHARDIFLIDKPIDA